ncbi:M48 family metallopeptidase [Proteocatella sphenisci]|uniref:M48 family metallopeptidase n=1 Tax=Proteocatella sphenisci TaxID=181070 RepID=UPI00048BD8E2|nr:SprT family zinc-dependent metalloprotease [Proteocatella sphenisci]
MQIEIKGKEVVFNIEYSKRKKMSLDVTPEGYVTVKAPPKTDEAEIIEFVKSNSKEILSVLEKLENRRYITREKSYVSEETFLYLGYARSLSQLLDQIPDSDEKSQEMVKKFYLSKTGEIVKKRVKHFEGIIGVKAKSVSIVDSPSTWGTCNSLRELTFNYRLSMASESVIDYVVIHELCHMHHLNHDRSFWRKVGSYDPSYREHQEYLARFGPFMSI